MTRGQIPGQIPSGQIPTLDTTSGRTEIEIEEPPLAVNLIINGSLDNKQEISQKRQQQLNRLHKISKKYNIDPSFPEIIIPIVSSKQMKAFSDYQTFHISIGWKHPPANCFHS